MAVFKASIAKIPQQSWLWQEKENQKARKLMKCGLKYTDWSSKEFISFVYLNEILVMKCFLFDERTQGHYVWLQRDRCFQEQGWNNEQISVKKRYMQEWRSGKRWNLSIMMGNILDLGRKRWHKSLFKKVWNLGQILKWNPKWCCQLKIWAQNRHMTKW